MSNKAKSDTVHTSCAFGRGAKSGRPRFEVTLTRFGLKPPDLNQFDLASFHEWLRAQGYKPLGK